MDKFLLIQIIGLTAIAVEICTQQIKNPRLIILCSTPANLLWALQYVMLGAPAGATTNGAGAFKNLGVFFLKQKWRPYIIGLYILTAWGLGLYLFSAWYDILPLLAVTALNLAFLQAENRPLIARAIIINCSLWIVYNAIVASWMGLICACLVICSSIIGMYRHENWDIGKCYKSFLPTLARSLFIFPKLSNV